MYTIHKFEIVAHSFKVYTDLVQILSVGLDPQGIPCIWCMVDTDRPKTSTQFSVFGTGDILPDNITMDFIGSITHRGYVWHIFRETSG